MSCITILLEVTAMNTTIFAFQNYHHSPKMHAILLAQTANKKLELEAYLEWNWDHSLHQLARHTVRRSTHFRLSAVRDLFPPGVYQHCSRPISPDLGVLWSLLVPRLGNLSSGRVLLPSLFSLLSDLLPSSWMLTEADKLGLVQIRPFSTLVGVFWLPKLALPESL